MPVTIYLIFCVPTQTKSPTEAFFISFLILVQKCFIYFAGHIWKPLQPHLKNILNTFYIFTISFYLAMASAIAISMAISILIPTSSATEISVQVQLSGHIFVCPEIYFIPFPISQTLSFCLCCCHSCFSSISNFQFSGTLLLLCGILFNIENSN